MILARGELPKDFFQTGPEPVLVKLAERKKLSVAILCVGFSRPRQHPHLLLRTDILPSS